jgi:hypothetical protein
VQCALDGILDFRRIRPKFCHRWYHQFVAFSECITFKYTGATSRICKIRFMPVTPVKRRGGVTGISVNLFRNRRRSGSGISCSTKVTRHGSQAQGVLRRQFIISEDWSSRNERATLELPCLFIWRLTLTGQCQVHLQPAVALPILNANFNAIILQINRNLVQSYTTIICKSRGFLLLIQLFCIIKFVVLYYITHFLNASNCKLS